MLPSTRKRLLDLERRADGQASYCRDVSQDLGRAEANVGLLARRISKLEDIEEKRYVGSGLDLCVIDDDDTTDECAEIYRLRDLVDVLRKDNNELRSALTGCTPRPTWVNKKGECMFVADIPTAYLVNIKNFLAKGKPGGILSVVIDELRSREQKGGH